MKNSRTSFRLAVPIAALVSAPLAAQTVPAPAAAPATRDESPLELSPFVVTTDKDVGYLATNTMSGSRLNTPLVDTPASISEMTKEFLEDIGATEMMNAVEYAMGFQSEQSGANDNTSQFNSNRAMARGLGRGTASRDFFSWGLSSDTFSVERISFSRGPNSILYGVGSAGGIINSMSKRASFRTRSEVNLRTDDNGSWRMHVDHNQRLRDNLALRLNLLHDSQRTWRELECTRSQRVHLAGTWRPFQRTEIRADYERGVQDRLLGLRFSARDYFLMWLDSGRPTYDRAVNGNTYPTGTVGWGTAPRLVYDGDANKWYNFQRYAQTRGRGGATANGLKMTSEEYVPFAALLLGPASTSDNAYWSGTVVLQQEVVKNLYLELAVNRQYDWRTVNRSGSQSELGVHLEPNRTLPDGTLNPYFGQMFVEGQALRNRSSGDNVSRRASLTYELNTRRKWLGHHRWLAMATDEDGESTSTQWNEANLSPLSSAVPAYSNAQNTVFRRTYLNFAGGNRSYNQDPFRKTYAPMAFADPANALAGTITPGFFVSNQSPTNSKNTAVMAAGQSAFWDGRLIVTYGVRKDEADRQNTLLTRHATTQEVTGVVWNPVLTYAGTTRTQGAVFHLTQSLSVYGNRSDNYSPQSGLDINGNNIGNVRGEGHDYGLKFRVGENQLHGRVGLFQTKAANQAGRNFNIISYIQGIWQAIEGATGEHVARFVGSPISNTDTQATEAKGVEVELTANPVKGLALTLNYATLKVQAADLYPISRAHIAQYRAQWAANSSLSTPLGGVNNTVGGALASIDANLAQDALQDGREALHNYPISLSGFGRYQFQGEKLKGWSLGAGARYRADRVLGYTPDSRPVRAPKWFLMDANFAHRRTLWNRRVDMRVQLNVQNLFDNRDLIWTAIDATTFQKNDYSLFAPRQFILSASFSYR
ncbi:MAG: TonB-dependent receptor plug domain-containing protein [Verrucomicrobia bacterium]|nr:TonB-dependent receptor plug domain-containing protein [Verrucomicrobiota bacterium]